MSNMIKTKSGRWVKLPTDAENETFQATAIADPDTPLLTDEQMTNMQPLRKLKSAMRASDINDSSFDIQPSSDDLQGNHETNYLLSVPGMRESIKNGMTAPIDDCAEDLDW